MTDKYDEMREQFEQDNIDECTIEKFIRQEKDMDEFRRNEGVADINAMKEWQEIPEDVRNVYLKNAMCHNCGVTILDSGYIVRKSKYGLVIEGTCSKCGEKIVRIMD